MRGLRDCLRNTDARIRTILEVAGRPRIERATRFRYPCFGRQRLQRMVAAGSNKSRSIRNARRVLLPTVIIEPSSKNFGRPNPRMQARALLLYAAQIFIPSLSVPNHEEFFIPRLVCKFVPRGISPPLEKPVQSYRKIICVFGQTTINTKTLKK